MRDFREWCLGIGKEASELFGFTDDELNDMVIELCLMPNNLDTATKAAIVSLALAYQLDDIDCMTDIIKTFPGGLDNLEKCTALAMAALREVMTGRMVN